MEDTGFLFTFFRVLCSGMAALCNEIASVAEAGDHTGGHGEPWGIQWHKTGQLTHQESQQAT